MRRLDRSRRDGARGQSIVEFALILPLLLILFLAVADLARIYSTMVTIESAAREAADFGAFNSRNWETSPVDNAALTMSQMRERACIAARNLPDYVGPDDNCTNPQIVIDLQEPDGATGSNCDDETRVDPCRVVVTLTHQFHLIVPLSISIFDVTVGFPSTMTFSRTSIFAISDFIIDTGT